jgi:uncharacterized protein YbjT (DUF2867 family)
MNLKKRGLSMKTACIFGATGVVGQALLSELIHHSEYSAVWAITRRPIRAPGDEKATTAFPHTASFHNEVIVFDKLKDFSLPNVQFDHVFCATGTTLKKTPHLNEYRKIEVDYVKDIASFAKRHRAQVFSLVSAIGANARSLNLYARQKGEVEKYIQSCGFTHTHIFRPSLIVGKREDFRAAEKVGALVMPLVTPLMKGKLRRYRPLSGDAISKQMIQQANCEETGVKIIYPAERNCM